jgi:hypothetical protein
MSAAPLLALEHVSKRFVRAPDLAGKIAKYGPRSSARSTT